MRNRHAAVLLPALLRICGHAHMRGPNARQVQVDCWCVCARVPAVNLSARAPPSIDSKLDTMLRLPVLAARPHFSAFSCISLHSHAFLLSHASACAPIPPSAC
eukprot:364976-Chlamydomonas_euryale.AAC.13